jgi:DNA adenine methylase
MDPPWQGVSRGRDARYAQPLDLATFIAACERLNARGIRYLVSFDGRTGERAHGVALPSSLGLKRVALHAGRSAQSTLVGRDELTVESLYLSPALLSERPRLATAAAPA